MRTASASRRSASVLVTFPIYVDRSADVEKAAHDIVTSVNFDYAVICAHENAVIADKPIADQLAKAMERNGAYFLSDEQADKLGKAMIRPNGLMQANFVGRSPQVLAEQAGFKVPDEALILVARLSAVGPKIPLSREKLTPVLAFYVEDGWHAGCARCIEILEFGGKGHTMGLHCTDEDIIMQFGLQKPAFRIIVNAGTTAGAIGYTTGPYALVDPGHRWYGWRHQQRQHHGVSPVQRETCRVRAEAV